MIATSHVIIGGAVGVAVGTVTQNPAAALAAGIVSHLICDALPHLDLPPYAKFKDAEKSEIIWDRSLYAFAITDSLIAMLAVIVIWYLKFDLNLTSMFAWGAFGGYLPDLVDNFPLWNQKLHQTPVFRQFHTFHHWIHTTWNRRFPMPKYWLLGIATQLILVLPSLYYLVK